MRNTNIKPEHVNELKAFIESLSEADHFEAIREIEKLKENARDRAFMIGADVYTSKDDPNSGCSAGGCTSFYDELYVFAEDMSLNAVLVYIESEGLDPFQCVQMENRRPCGEDYYNAVPVLPSLRKKWHMFGGAYIKSSDSRFREVTGMRYPVPVHDRIEEWN